MEKDFKITTAILEAFEDGIYVMNQELQLRFWKLSRTAFMS